ncbi:hypothetical protein XELAEV_18045958mg [Xenopus laevis]|uniref:Uncharacterized protein n=1 Tax=Xenopus laevis TaxID=8355 RepID=A0A974BRZ5_XENLA|nr:hypothetical protein XELAEV_18045958mg [Xenopus laevis]
MMLGGRPLSLTLAVLHPYRLPIINTCTAPLCICDPIQSRTSYLPIVSEDPSVNMSRLIKVVLALCMKYPLYSLHP